jgi:nitrate reductase gamma subunit
LEGKVTELLLLISVLPYLTAVVFVGGITYRVLRWLGLPVPTMIMLTPAPITRSGVVKRLGVEFFVFASLRKAGRKLWLGGWLFHILLGLTLLTHIVTIFFPPIWATLGYGLYQTAGYAGILFAAVLCFLLFRRIFHPGIRYVSRYSDYFTLMFLIILVLLGNYLRAYGKVELGPVSSYFYSLLTFQPILPPIDLAFLSHLLLAQIFLMYLPFSKVVHLIGWVLAPTKNQRNVARAEWHQNPWNPIVKTEEWNDYARKFQRELEELGPGGERR